VIRLVARRLGWALVVIWFVITATFALTAAIPADPAKALLGPHADEAAVERQTLAFLAQHVPAGVSPMCGNSICQDRRFMARYMPKLEDWFHYRNLDVSTLKELCKRWKPEVAKGLKKHGKHEALADILESIAELKYYREHFLKL